MRARDNLTPNPFPRGKGTITVGATSRRKLVKPARGEVEGVGEELVGAHPGLMVVHYGYDDHFVDVEYAGDIDQGVADVVGSADYRARPLAGFAERDVVDRRA